MIRKHKWLMSLVLILALSNLTAYSDTSVASNSYRRDTVGANEIAELDQDGDLELQGDFAADLLLGNEGVKIGDAQTAPTLPTTTTGSQFGVKVPFYNASGSAMAQGYVVVASAAINNTMYGSVAAITSTTTVVGICEGTVASAADGYMTVAGIALVLTTGTVAIGDLLVSTTVAGYAGKIASGATVEEGSVIGKALSQGTAAGGLTLIRLF